MIRRNCFIRLNKIWQRQARDILQIKHISRNKHFSQRCRTLPMDWIFQNFAGRKTFTKNLPTFHHRPGAVSSVFWCQVYFHHTKKLGCFKFIFVLAKLVSLLVPFLLWLLASSLYPSTLKARRIWIIDCPLFLTVMGFNFFCSI